MPNQLFPKAKETLLAPLLVDTYKAVLVSNAYVFAAAHEFLPAIEQHIIGTAVELTGKSIAGGVFDAADITFPLVPTGHTAKAVVIYKDTGVAGTSRLLDYIDVVAGLPMQTNGGDVSIKWDEGQFKIFSL